MRKALAVAIFAHYQGEFLFIKHKRLRVWLPVGGEVEPGELPLDAAKRELMEEAGLIGTFHPHTIHGTPDGFLGYEEHLAGSKGLHMCFSFIAELPSKAVVLNEEADEHVFTSSQVPDPSPPNVFQLFNLAKHTVFLSKHSL